MNTKEAIEFIKKHNRPVHFYTWERKGFKEIIELLKRGEKYKEMWKELRLSNKYSEAYELQPPITMMELEQKYFPKPKEINWKDRFDELEEEFKEREAELIKEIEYWKFRNFSGRNHDV